MAQSQNTITQRIALAGVEDITKQLAALGVTGEAAVAKIQTAVAATAAAGGLGKLNSITASLAAGFARVRTAIEPVGAALGELGTAAGKFGGAIESVGTRVGVFAAGAALALVEVVKSAAEAAKAVKEGADQLGIGIKAYQGLKFAAEAAGVANEKFAVGMTRFAKNVQTAASAQSDATIKAAQLIVGATAQSGVQIARGTSAAADAVAKLDKVATDTGAKLISVPGPIKNIEAAAQQMALALQKAGDTESLAQLVNKIKAVAGQTDSAGVEMRKLLAAMGAPVPGTTLFENLEDQLKDNNAVLTKLIGNLHNADGSIIDTGTALNRLADAFVKLPNGIEKTAEATALFGRNVSNRLQSRPPFRT